MGVTSSTIPDELDEITDEIIGAAVRVHDDLGPGLLEGIYQEALLLELDRQGLSVSAEVEAPVTYRGQDLSRRCRIDLLVEDQVVLEIKAIENIRPVHRAKLLTYLRITEKRVGLLLNFHRSRLVDGIHRIVR